MGNFEGQYKNPKYNVTKPERKFNKNAKILAVLNTYIPKGFIVQYNSRLYPSDEYKRYIHHRLECLKFTLACYNYFNAGMKYDLIIVDNDSPEKKYLKNLKIPVYFRENTYFSFGAYRYAWRKFRDQYDYYIFHEMDWVPAKHYWLKDLVKKWVSDKRVGMIGNLVENREWTDNPQTDEQKVNNVFIEKINPKRKIQCNLDSEYLFTSSFVLRQMVDCDGWLIFKCSPKTNLSPAYNELAFQQPILEMGYKISSYNDGKHTMFYSIYNRNFLNEWNHGLENLVPFVPEQTRLFISEMREYFNFYDHEKNNSYKGDI